MTEVILGNDEYKVVQMPDHEVVVYYLNESKRAWRRLFGKCDATFPQQDPAVLLKHAREIRKHIDQLRHISASPYADPSQVVTVEFLTNCIDTEVDAFFKDSPPPATQ